MRCIFAAVLFLSCASLGHASVFGTVQGVVHDPDHRPVEGVAVTLRSRTSEWSQSLVTDSEGGFRFLAVPAGRYLVAVSHPGFNSLEQMVEVQSGSAPVLHFALKIAPMNMTVQVSADPEWINTDSPSAGSIVSRKEIAQSPGADRTNSLAMITNFVPGATIVHDQLHIRGGHQVSWLIDGVTIPNTNIATNVGPQFDPHDIDYLEIKRGGYSSEYGDRTFGIFNVVPRSGFERDNEAELTLSYGSLNETNDHLSFGSHTQRFAYYVGLTGNRTDAGLQPPSSEILHDLSSSASGFTSMTYNPDGANQLRLVGSVRADHYQVPNTQEQQDSGAQDVQKERDAFVNFSWVHVLGPGTLLTVSPFYHHNRAAFVGGLEDNRVIATDDHKSDYAGGEMSLSHVTKRHNLRLGFSAWSQRERSLLSLGSDSPADSTLGQLRTDWGEVEAAYAEDQFRITPLLTLTGGLRLTHFSGNISENAASPRLGAAFRIPRLNWVARGFYGRYYQPPPLATVSGPLLDLALQEGFGYLPLYGERDEQYELGLAVPILGWAIDLSHFHTNAHNFFDHTPLGNADIFFPVTIESARIRGWEAMVRSPRLFNRADLHLVYSRQYAQGRGPITGGLTDFSPPESDLFYLDHDQRDTLAGGFETELPRKAWIAGNLAFGSGFLDGDGPAHLPSHTTFDLSFGKSFGESFSARVTALNLTDARYLLDNSNSFGGTHYNFPRQIAVTLRYRFHY